MDHFARMLKDKPDRKLVKRGKLRGKYWKILKPDHPDADLAGYLFEHRWIAEQALGKRLPFHCHVHHVDGNSQNNTPSNLVICEDAKYHYLLHERAESLAQTGNANSTKCENCTRWVIPDKKHVCAYVTRGGRYARPINDIYNGWRRYNTPTRYR